MKSSTVKFDSPSAFHLMVKPTGAICNLDCQYCFYLAKEMLYPYSRFRMAENLLELYVQQLLESHSHTSEVIFCWQGGEPTLMGLDFFRLAIKYIEKHRKPHHRDILYNLQTNGTLLNHEWCEFFKQHNFLIGLSIDGPQHLHDSYRVTKKGQGTFKRVMEAYQLLQSHDVDTNILCTVNRVNSNHPLEVYRFFRDELNTRFLQFIPIVESEYQEDLLFQDLQESQKRISNHSVEAKQFGNFLIAIFDEWIRQDVGKVFIQHFDVALSNWLGITPSVCIFAKTCGSALALEHNGDVYSCDHFVEPQYKLGNIQETHISDLVNSQQQKQFGQAKQDTLPIYCQKCEVLFACNGGCPKNRFIDTPDGESGLNYLCAGYKAFFKHIDKPMRIMAMLLRTHRAPAEIMVLLPKLKSSQISLNS